MPRRRARENAKANHQALALERRRPQAIRRHHHGGLAGRARRQMDGPLATSERGVYFATYRGSFMGPETALESYAGGLAA